MKKAINYFTQHCTPQDIIINSANHEGIKCHTKASVSITTGKYCKDHSVKGKKGIILPISLKVIGYLPSTTAQRMQFYHFLDNL